MLVHRFQMVSVKSGCLMDLMVYCNYNRLVPKIVLIKKETQY